MVISDIIKHFVLTLAVNDRRKNVQVLFVISNYERAQLTS